MVKLPACFQEGFSSLSFETARGMSMDFAKPQAIRAAGFDGFVSVKKLRETRCSDVPAVAGVYLVLRLNPGVARYMEKNQGGHFKGRDPSVSAGELASNWVADALVVYIGKAGGGASQSTLRKRLWSLMRFGAGEPVGHWGGRLLWQLEDCSDLILCWKPTGSLDAGAYESELISAFARTYGARPFANLRD
jgi:hypothetical protein